MNLLALPIRQASANHKRETLAFSKQRGRAALRLAILLVWRNYMKSVSERKRDATPAQRLGVATRLLGVEDVLVRRLFPTRIEFPELGARYHWWRVRRRRLPHAPEHRRVFAI